MQLKDKVAIVTGAASGIGKEIASLFARQGAKVTIADLNAKGAEAVAAELGGAKQAIGLAVDVTNEQQTTACVAATIAAFGRLDILVSNAGIQTVAPIDQFDFAKWKQLLAIHLDGAFLTTRAALREMYKSNRGGSIFTWGRCIPRRLPC
jgi:3-hydroxybutyrate dehydrogenase